MSTEFPSNQTPLVAPKDTDEQFIARLEFEDPIRKASIWLHKLIIHRLRDVQLSAQWYLGVASEPPEKLVSDLFSQEDGRLCDRFAYYCRMIKKYRQGEVPHQVIEDDLRITKLLISALSKLSDNADTLRLLSRRILEFVHCVTARDGARMLRYDYIRRIDELADSIVTLCGRVGDEFLRIEKLRRGETSVAATKSDIQQIAGLAESTDRKTDSLLAIAEDTVHTVKRIDRRGKKNNRQCRFTVEQQEQCFRYWMLGRKKDAVKMSTPGKVGHIHVFTYYRKELASLGIKDAKSFESALGARSDRIRRAKLK